MHGPVEVLLLIINEIIYDAATLRACALVSPIFNSICHQFLFQEIKIVVNPSFLSKVQNLHSVLSARPALLADIRSLNITFDCGSVPPKGDLLQIFNKVDLDGVVNEAESFPNFINLLHLLLEANSLRKLTIRPEIDGVYVSWSALRQPVTDALLALRALPSLESLDVSYVQQLDRRFVIGEPRCYLRDLRMLQVHFFTMANFGHMGSLIDPHIVASVPMDEIIDFFAAIESIDSPISCISDLLPMDKDIGSLRFPLLRRLAGQHVTTSNRRFANILAGYIVRSAINQLQSLAWFINPTATSFTFGLDELKALRHLHLLVKTPDIDRFHSVGRVGDHIVALFDVKTSSHIERIVIDFYWVFMPMNHTLDELGGGENFVMHQGLWPRLDDIFTRSRYADLRRLEIRFKLTAIIRSDLMPAQTAQDHLAQLYDINAMFPGLRASKRVNVDISMGFKIMG